MKIGIIPDGNRKWAKLKGISLEESYRQGGDIAFALLKSALQEKDIDLLVFYVLSKENYQERTKEEVGAILRGIEKGIRGFSTLPDVELSLFGDSVPKEVNELFILCDKLKNSSDSKKLKVIFLVNYSPIWDFETKPIRSHSIPDLDCVIRTGESRLSGFLPMQSRNSQLYFPEGYWGNFSFKRFEEIIKNYRDNYSKIIHGK